MTDKELVKANKSVTIETIVMLSLVAICGFVFIGGFVYLTCCEREVKETLYDVELKLHYIDGYSETVREDSIYCEDLPQIVEGFIFTGGKYGHYERLGTYSLYFCGKRYHGVIRYEYLYKRKYIFIRHINP